MLNQKTSNKNNKFNQESFYQERDNQNEDENEIQKKNNNNND